MGKKMGRPKIPKNQSRGTLVAARFRPDELKEIERAIRKAGLSKSEWVRVSLLEKARKL